MFDLRAPFARHPPRGTAPSKKAFRNKRFHQGEEKVLYHSVTGLSSAPALESLCHTNPEIPELDKEDACSSKYGMRRKLIGRSAWNVWYGKNTARRGWPESFS